MVKGVRKRHFSEMMVMPVTFAVGCNVYKLWPLPRIGESASQPLREVLPIVEEMLEGHGLRDGAIVEIRCQSAPRRQFHLVGPGWINPLTMHILPRACTQFANSARLAWRQNREFNSKFCKQVQRFEIHGGFRQPH